ncbi:MAG: light-harvesting complex 1 beta chain [Sphingomonas echinoides]|jgi:light-harvesting complex 1 beta chain
MQPGSAFNAPVLGRQNGDGAMSDNRNERLGPGTYLTPDEAKEFHKIFVTSFLIFTSIAVVAHILVWVWKPWIQ